MKKLLRCSFYLLLFCLPLRSVAQLFSPVIVPLPTTLSAFSTTTGTASAAQTSAIIGLFITSGGVTATAPAGFEISTDGSTYGTTVTFLQGAVLSGTTLYARLLASDGVGTYSGIIKLKDGSTTATITIPASTVNPPPPLITTSGTPSAVTSTLGNPSLPTSFTVSGTNMLAGITVTAPAGFEVSIDGGLNYGSAETTANSSSIGPVTVDVRLKSTDAGGVYSGNIVLTSTGAPTVKVMMPPSTMTPLPAITATAVSGSPVTTKGTPSIPVTFDVSGNNLNADVLITAPSGFEVSSNAGVTFASTAITGPFPTFGPNTIQVRLTGVNSGTFSGNIILSSTGALDVPVAITGSVSTNPVVMASSPIPGLTTIVGTSSVTENFPVSGVNVNSDGVLVTPPTGFEVSTDGTNYFPTVTIPPGTGNFNNVPVYVRLLASDAVGGYSGDIRLSTSGTSDVPVTINTSTVTPLLPTVSTTAPASGITATTAGLQGNVTADGGGTVTEKGIVYSTSNNPTTADTKKINGTGLGIISVNATGLIANTVYHYRAYAINAAGPAYGSDETFTTLSPPTISSFTPTTGPAGTLVTISGTNLSSQAGLLIGGANAIVLSDDGSTIVAMVMPGATTGDIEVATLGGNATSSGNFTTTLTLYPLGQKQTKLVGSGASGPAGQGGGVALSADGNTAVVSGPDDNAEVGALWVYTRSGGVWSQQGSKLVGTGSTGTSEQGFSVAISADGNTIIEGGPFDNSSQGAAWVFTRTGGTWTQQAKLTATGEIGAAQLGTSIALSADGNTAAIGGYDDNTVGGNSQGAVWVFTRSGAAWTQQTKLIGTGAAAGNVLQGYSVAISADGNTIAEGGKADQNSDGAVWVFTQSGGIWSQQGTKLVGSVSGSSEQGFSVALSADGNTLAEGGPFDNSDIGAAWVFTRTGTTWTEQKKLIGSGNTGTGATMGTSIAISADGNTLISGGPKDNSNVGASWAFTRSAGIWSQQYFKFHAYDVTGAATEGNDIAISADGTTAFTGAEEDNGGIGAAWPYIVLVPPTVQATNVTFTNVNPTTADVAWTNGNGLLRAVFISKSNSGQPFPVDYMQYNANTVFGSGDQVGTTGWYCIYNGVGGSTVSLTGLSPNTTYRVMAVEYNGTFTDVNYLTTTVPTNPKSITTVGPVITETDALTAMTTVYGSPSTPQTFHVSGTLIETGGITVTAPTGFEVSTDGIHYGATATVAGTGTIASTPVTIRMLATDVVGSTYSGNVVMSGTDATSVNLATVASTVTPKQITVTVDANQSKTYGATDPATYMYTSTALVSGDTFTGSLSRVTGENVGNYNITVGSLALSANYQLNFTAGTTFGITPKQITVTVDANQSKTYGAADPAIYTYTSTALVGGDTFTGSLSRVTGENVGNYNITVGSLALSANYQLNFTAGTTFGITPKQIRVTVDANQSKTYGAADPAIYTYTSTALVGGDTFTGSLSRVTGENVGNYNITVGSLALSANYQLNFTAGTTFGITPKQITVTVDANQSKTYGAADPAIYTYTSTALVGGDTFTGSLSRVTGENVGNYNITVGSLALSANYQLNFTAGTTFGITPKQITVTVDANQSKTYGAADPAIYTYTSTALVGGDTFTGSLSRVTGENVGNYNITVGSLALSANYQLNFTAGTTFGITPKQITVTVDANQSKTYGAADPAIYTYTSTALVGGDTFTGSLSRVTGENVGNYNITVGSLALSANYQLNFTAGTTFGITPKQITVTVDANQSKTYGAADPAIYTYTSTALVGGDTFTGSLSRVTGENVGNYNITVGSLALSTNYQLNFTAGTTFGITTKTITVTVTAGQSKTYGATDPASYAYTSTALVSGDTFTGTLSRDAGENVGNYNILQGSLALSANYQLNFTAGTTFGITPKQITVTVDANQSKTYGAADPAIYTYTSTALVGGDTFAGALSRVTGENVGNYNITVGSLALSTNYQLNFTAGTTFGITPKQITVTVDANQSKTYGATDPATYMYTSTALVSGDTFTGTLSRDAGENVGNYNITVGSLALSANYQLNFTAGTTFGITTKTITVTVTAGQSKTYGATDPATYMYTSTALVSGDTFTGTLSRDAGENVGNYNITVGSLALSANYQLNFTAGTTFGITPKQITVTVDANQSKTYGAADPATYIYTSTALVSGDTFTGTLSRDAGENVGNYNITVGSLALSANYQLNFTAGTTFGITPKQITVTVDANQSKTYGAADPAIYTYTSTALVGGDTFTGSLSRVTGENVGNYNITVGSLALSANYQLNFTAGTTFGITPKQITVTVDANQSKTYGAADPAIYTYTSTALVGGDTFTGSLSRVTGENVGNYNITVGSLALSANYQLNFTAGTTFGITPKQITVTVDANQSKTYGAADPAIYTYTSTALVGGDTFTGSLSRVTGENVGNYNITVGSLALSTNYQLNFTAGTTFEVNKANLNITVNNATKVYGSANPVFTLSFNGLVNGDTPANFGRAPFITTLATTGSDAGSYAINASGASSNNYNVTSSPGTLTITAAPLTVIANDISRNYATINPPLTVHYVGFVNGDNAASFNSQPVATTSATFTSLPGKYPITVSGANNPNYTIGYTSATFTVLALTNSRLDNLTVTNGILSPNFISGLTNYTVDVPYSVISEAVTPSIGDATATITVNGKTVLSGQLSQSIPLAVGLNSITVIVTAQDGITKTTYNITATRENPPPAVITAAGILPSQNTVYGTHSSVASFTVLATSALTGLLITPPAGFEVSLTSNGTFTKTVTVGTGGTINPTLVYIRLAASTQVGVYAGNITVATTNGSASIAMPASRVTPTTLLITADDKTKFPETVNPYLTLTYTGLVNGDSPADLLKSPTVTTTAQTNSPAGTYPIKVTGAESPNYIISYQDGTLTITPLAIHNSFTPNGDGINDTWEIDALKNYPTCTVSIFTRAGTRVFYSINYPVAWDGRINGQDLPSGTYYYVIDLKNGSKPLSGWVAVIR